MPSVEEGRGGTRSSANVPSRFDGPRPGGAARPTPRPAPSRREPAPADAGRFERVNLHKLTPYAAPVEKPLEFWNPAAMTSGPALPSSTAEGLQEMTWAKPNTFANVRPEPKDKPRSPEWGEREGKPKTRRTYQMTWEDYQALSPGQRAAVDFNTLLVRAREKDLTSDYEPTDQQRHAYDAAIERMFGEGHGSETYAPETLEVLNQIKFKDDNEDLDNFLSLDRTISEKELGAFTLEKQVMDLPLPGPVAAVSGRDSYQVDVTTPEQGLAKNTSAMLSAMAKSNELLQNLRASATGKMHPEFFGGAAADPRIGLGFGTRELRAGTDQEGVDEYFRKTFDLMAQKPNGPEQLQFIWDDVNARMHPDEKRKFLRYLDTRSQRAADYKLPMGEGKGVDYRTPEEFRQLLGFDRQGGDRG